jgi:type VI secretion system protein ImpA
MGKLNLDSLVQPVSAEAPSGADLTYDPAFTELERVAQGTAEQQIGDTIVAAEEPNWRDVGDRCIELLGRTKHLRVLLFLIVAQLRQDGLPGLRDALAVLRGVLEKHWDTVYPQLDPEDNSDPLERMNIIASLGVQPGTFGDNLKFYERVQRAPLAASKKANLKVSLHDMLVAKGELSPAVPAPGGPPAPDTKMVDGVFSDASTEDLQAVATAADEAAGHVQEIGKILDQRVGLGQAPNLKGFEDVIRQAGKQVQTYLARRGVGTAPAEETGGSGGGGRPAGSPLTGEILTQSDVLLALDKVCRYYETNEVSSPVPLLVKCAQRMVSKKFLEITKVLTPEAIRMVEEMSGSAPEQVSS